MKTKIKYTIYIFILLALVLALFTTNCRGQLSTDEIRPVPLEENKVRPPGEGVKLGTGKNMNYRLNTP
jgi:hypothetical protein